jgi:succinyl-CoA synthetase beta subunit
MTKKTYHIYLNDKCLFKNLNEEEFDIIWNKLYTSYWKEEITYTEVNDLSLEDSTIYEHSY